MRAQPSRLDRRRLEGRASIEAGEGRSTEILAGVDGGATKTTAVIGTPEGILLRRAHSSSSNYHNVGVRRAAWSIRDAVQQACRPEGVSIKGIDIVVMGLAAMDCPTDFVAGRTVARIAGVGKRHVVKHDSVIALYAATLGRPGIVVNAGTGSFAAGIDRRGSIIRAGGWGNVVDDEGSAYHIGKLAIRAALRSIDGREKETVLTRLLKRRFRLRELENIVYDIYSRPITVDELSTVSELVGKAASMGDRVARGIFEYEGRVLANLVAAIARRLGMTGSKPDVYCIGGVFNAGNVLLGPFRQELHRSIPRFVIRRPRFEPVVGAFILALRERGKMVHGHTLANLNDSCARLSLLQ